MKPRAERTRDGRGRRGKRLALALAAVVITLVLQAAEPPPPPALAPLEAWLDGCFATSLACAPCHSNAAAATALRDAERRPVAPFDLWRSSMMASAARDPLWRAMVSTEVAAHPQRRADIEAKCLGCHAPMAAIEKRHAGDVVSLAELHDPKARHVQLGIDGVSCTVCHQMEADRLGTATSFGGAFTIASAQRIYGPHEQPFAMPMRRHTGFVPQRGDHILTSALCGSCHTLITHAITPDGESATPFVEQSPYLEWRNSVFNDEVAEPGPHAASCQSCHVPPSDIDGHPIRTRIARNPGGRDFPPVAPRAPFGRHVFVGGNTLVPALLRDHAEKLQPNASPEAFDATIAAARRQLVERTARLELEPLGVMDGRLRLRVRVENLTGHKFPSGHPTRRAWLRVVAHDDAGGLVFRSGDVDGAGRIVGADDRPLATERQGGPHQPHRRVIRDSCEVQIYEGLMADGAGRLTFGLLEAERYLKDNRLLPRGWRADHPDGPATAPHGIGEDPSFGSGADAIVYEIPLAPDGGALRLDVSLRYQTLGARYAAELLAVETPEVAEFRGYWEGAERRGEVVAHETLEFRGGL